MANYTVHSAHNTTAVTRAHLPDGTEVQATMPVLLIELVPVDSYRGWLSHIVLTNTPEAKEAAEALFKVGNVVSMGDFTLAQEGN